LSKRAVLEMLKNHGFVCRPKIFWGIRLLSRQNVRQNVHSSSIVCAPASAGGGTSET
jgi:hypothetical protein